MSIKILEAYIKYCNINNIIPTFDGLILWKQSQS